MFPSECSVDFGMGVPRIGFFPPFLIQNTQIICWILNVPCPKKLGSASTRFEGNWYNRHIIDHTPNLEKIRRGRVEYMSVHKSTSEIEAV